MDVRMAFAWVWACARVCVFYKETEQARWTPADHSSVNYTRPGSQRAKCSITVIPRRDHRGM